MLSKLRKTKLREQGENTCKSDKVLISITHEDLLKFNIKKENNLIKNELKFRRQFSKGNILFPNDDFKKMQNMISHQRNANEKHNVIKHSTQNG